MRLNIGCGPHYAPGWTNVDRVRRPDDELPILPDIVADTLAGLPFDTGSADAVYLGHVLEHVAWPQVLPFLAEIRRVCAPGGQVAVVGPDIILTIHEWHEGREPWRMVESVMEHAAAFMTGGEAWDGARHAWNCYEARAADCLEAAGFTLKESFTGRLGDLRPLGWPLVAASAWQFGFTAVAP